MASQSYIYLKTLEFGSFMLEPRQGNVRLRYLYYGACPCAMIVRENRPKQISIPSLPYTRSDVNNFFSHLAFEIGEHHSNKPVKQLVDALYRYVGMEPDPSHEFDGYWEEIKDDGFAIIEINIRSINNQRNFADLS